MRRLLRRPLALLCVLLLASADFASCGSRVSAAKLRRSRLRFPRLRLRRKASTHTHRHLLLGHRRNRIPIRALGPVRSFKQPLAGARPGTDYAP